MITYRFFEKKKKTKQVVRPNKSTHLFFLISCCAIQPTKTLYTRAAVSRKINSFRFFPPSRTFRQTHNRNEKRRTERKSKNKVTISGACERLVKSEKNVPPHQRRCSRYRARGIERRSPGEKSNKEKRKLSSTARLFPKAFRQLSSPSSFDVRPIFGSELAGFQTRHTRRHGERKHENEEGNKGGSESVCRSNERNRDSPLAQF